jgi:hypothetical protein
VVVLVVCCVAGWQPAGDGLAVTSIRHATPKALNREPREPREKRFAAGKETDVPSHCSRVWRGSRSESLRCGGSTSRLGSVIIVCRPLQPLGRGATDARPLYKVRAVPMEHEQPG